MKYSNVAKYILSMKIKNKQNCSDMDLCIYTQHIKDNIDRDTDETHR